MKIVVTGAAGFLGGRVADALLAEPAPLPLTALLLTDVAAPPARADPRVSVLALDVSAPGAGDTLLADCDLLLHLAAVVSGQAEADFDLGFQVNFDATRAILEAARRRVQLGGRPPRVVLASTCAVYGGPLPAVVGDDVAAMPQSTYGTAKAMSELLLNEYSRRGFVDGRAVRLPTVTVRAGPANTAVTSFASGVVREPVHGLEAVVPVAPEQEMWVCSPRAAVHYFVHAASLPEGALGEWRALAMPGLAVTVRDMVGALRAVCGERTAARVRYDRDERAARIVRSLPSRFDARRALGLGFTADVDFADIIRDYIRDENIQLKEKQ